jgi:hypothetical protein
MRIYTLHKLKDPSQEVVSVKEGFSWLAFLFSPVWALSHSLWFWAFGFVVGHVFLHWVVVELGWHLFGQSFVYLALAIIIGWIANDLRRCNLSKRGFEERAVLLAENKEHAAELYIMGYLKNIPAVSHNRAGGPW